MSKNESSSLLSATGLGRITTSGYWLFKEIGLQTGAGERWAIRGKSGSGKTVLMRTLCLLDEPDAGELLWKGKPVLACQVPAYRQQVVYLHQRPVLQNGTVQENLELIEQFVPPGQQLTSREQTNAWLEACHKPASFLNTDSSLLSGGERQIVALIRALRLQPTILLLDEPTASLDAESRQAVEDLVQNWFTEKPGERVTVWVSHDNDQLERMTENSLEISTGQISLSPSSRKASPEKTLPT